MCRGKCCPALCPRPASGLPRPLPFGDSTQAVGDFSTRQTPPEQIPTRAAPTSESNLAPRPAAQVAVGGLGWVWILFLNAAGAMAAAPASLWPAEISASAGWGSQRPAHCSRSGSFAAVSWATFLRACTVFYARSPGYCRMPGPDPAVSLRADVSSCACMYRQRRAKPFVDGRPPRLFHAPAP